MLCHILKFISLDNCNIMNSFFTCNVDIVLCRESMLLSGIRHSVSVLGNILRLSHLPLPLIFSTIYTLVEIKCLLSYGNDFRTFIIFHIILATDCKITEKLYGLKRFSRDLDGRLTAASKFQKQLMIISLVRVFFEVNKYVGLYLLH